MDGRSRHPAHPPTEVLVVGAGPVGLVTALELVRRGRRVRIVDAAPGPASSSRALGSHARSLEVYDQLGLREKITARARPVAGFSLHQGGRELLRLDLDLSPTPTPITSSWFIAQADIEDVLRTALARAGDSAGVPAGVEWSTTMTRLENRADGVDVELDGPQGRQTVAVRYLVGADGGHSTVRKELGLPFVGGASETWLVADADLDTDLPDDSIHLLRGRAGTIMAFPFPDPGRWRLLDTADTDGGPDAIAARFSTKLDQALHRPTRVGRIRWHSSFTIQQRQVPTLSIGRVFLAGDAAHVHSPASGQGLNTGIQDAHNLAWKLAAVLGGADPALLESYSLERRPVSAQLLRSAAVATRFVQGRGLLGALTGPAAALVAHVPALRRRASRDAARSFSALTIDYGHSPVTTADAPPDADQPHGADTGPRPGRRITQLTAAQARTAHGRLLLEALRQPRHLLLDLTTSAELATVDLGDDVVRLALPQPTVGDAATLPESAFPAWRNAADWYLVRPDGYVAARGRAHERDRLTHALRRATGRVPVPADLTPPREP